MSRQYILQVGNIQAWYCLNIKAYSSEPLAIAHELVGVPIEEYTIRKG